MTRIMDAKDESFRKTWQKVVPQTETAPSSQRDEQGLTPWQQADAKICRHPFLQNFSKEQRSSMQKRSLRPDVDEMAYNQMRKQFIDFLADMFRIKSLILKNIYKDSADYEAEDGNPDCFGTLFKKALERDEDYKQLPQRSKLRSQFDGLAYSIAVSNCIARYDANYINPKTGRPASFLGLFSAEYKNCLNDIRSEYTTGLIDVSKADRRNISKIVRYLRTQYPNYTNKELPDSIYQELSDIFDLPLKKIKILIAAAQISQTVPWDATVGESDISVGERMPDTSNDFGFPLAVDTDNLQDSLDIYAVIQAISSLELKDYNRLLMDNTLLYPIHPETYSHAVESQSWPSSENTKYKDALKRYHDRLKKGVWDFSYLNFVGWKNEKGNTGQAEDIQVLCDYCPVQPLQKQTIAKYRNVSSANVSYYMKKFDALRCQVKQLLLNG